MTMKVLPARLGRESGWKVILAKVMAMKKYSRGREAVDENEVEMQNNNGVLECEI